MPAPQDRISLGNSLHMLVAVLDAVSDLFSKVPRALTLKILIQFSCSRQHSNLYPPQSEDQASTEVGHGHLSLPLFCDGYRINNSHFRLPNEDAGSGVATFLDTYGSLYRPDYGQFDYLPHRVCYNEEREQDEEEEESKPLIHNPPALDGETQTPQSD